MSNPVSKLFARILMATDGSPNSQKACEAAAQIASSFGSNVIVMNAIPSVGPLAASPGGERNSKMITKSQDIVERAASVFQKAGVAVSKKKASQGSSSPAETILECAAEEKADLIVMGTRGMGGFKRAVLGSVSSAVAMHSHCATLVVRPGKREDDLRPISRIMVAFDGSENAWRALEVAVDMAKNMNVELQLAHVTGSPTMIWSLGLPSGATIPMGKIEDDAENTGQQVVSKALKYAEDSGVPAPKSRIVTKITSPAQGLVELAEENEVDVIVIGTRGMGGFKKLILGSVANSVLHYTHCSVLVVK